MKSEIAQILASDFEKRTAKNQQYSLRAFARDLKLVPSHLSALLRNQVGLSQRKAQQIAEMLKISSSEKKYFVELAISQYSRSALQRSFAKNKLKKMNIQKKQDLQIDQELFCLFSDWYHFAILELTYLKNFRSDSHWISMQLSIEIEKINEALVRLLKYKLLVLKDGKLKATNDYTSTGDSTPSGAVQKFHGQILELASESILTQTVHERCLRTTILAIRQDKISAAFSAIEQFHKDFCEEIGEDELMNGQKEWLYVLGTQFFKLNKPTKKTKKVNYEN